MTDPGTEHLTRGIQQWAFDQMTARAKDALAHAEALQAQVTDLERSLAHHRQVTKEMNDWNHRYSDRISAAVTYLENEIDGAEESRSRDSMLSEVIGILKGELRADGTPR